MLEGNENKVMSAPMPAAAQNNNPEPETIPPIFFGKFSVSPMSVTRGFSDLKRIRDECLA